MKLLRYRQTAADDWGDIRHSRRPIAKPKRDWVDVIFKWGLFGWLMGAIWGPVMVIVIIGIVVLIV